MSKCIYFYKKCTTTAPSHLKALKFIVQSSCLINLIIFVSYRPNCISHLTKYKQELIISYVRTNTSLWYKYIKVCSVNLTLTVNMMWNNMNLAEMHLLEWLTLPRRAFNITKCYLFKMYLLYDSSQGPKCLKDISKQVEKFTSLLKFPETGNEAQQNLGHEWRSY